MSRTITLHADGSCLGNPGPGGWAATIEIDGEILELSGGAAATTNNRMELCGAIEALRLIACRARPGDSILMRLDSRYVLDGLFSWLPGWQRKGWRKATGEPVKNDDLWRVIAEQKRSLEAAGVTLVNGWLKGHAGHEGNELVDKRAREMAESFA